MLKRVRFDSVIKVHEDGAMEVIKSIKIGNTNVSQGVKVKGDFMIDKINLRDYIGRELLLEESDGIATLVALD